MITFALSKGRILDDTRPLLRTAGIDVLEDPESSRKLILPTQRDDVRGPILAVTPDQHDLEESESNPMAKAARALGVSEWRIMLRHVLPNALVAVFTFLPFLITGAITTLTSLDFLGFGLPAWSPSLGELLAQGKANPEAPWLGMTGFLVLAVMLSLLIFIGEAVRDALDPRKTFR